MQAGGGKTHQVIEPKTLIWFKYGLVLYQCRDLTTAGGVPILGMDCRIQQQQLVGDLPKPTESMEAVGYVTEVRRKYDIDISK